jgi:hypothetical protein
LVQLIDILRGSMPEAQLTNLTLVVFNKPNTFDSPDDWSMVRKVNDRLYFMADKKEGYLLIRKLEVN